MYVRGSVGSTAASVLRAFQGVRNADRRSRSCSEIVCVVLNRAECLLQAGIGGNEVHVVAKAPSRQQERGEVQGIEGAEVAGDRRQLPHCAARPDGIRFARRVSPTPSLHDARGRDAVVRGTVAHLAGLVATPTVEHVVGGDPAGMLASGAHLTKPKIALYGRRRESADSSKPGRSSQRGRYVPSRRSRERTTGARVRPWARCDSSTYRRQSAPRSSRPSNTRSPPRSRHSCPRARRSRERSSISSLELSGGAAVYFMQNALSSQPDA
jgi:hypothetical protein